jgi:uncharacterized membrane protein
MSPKDQSKNSRDQEKRAAQRPEIVPDTLREELISELQNLIQNRQVPSVVDRVVAVVSQHSYNESKLPSAYELKALEEAVPGGAKMAVDMAQREQEFILDETRRNNRRGFLLDFIAPIFGLVGLALLIGLCVFMVHKGYATQAVVAAIGVIGTVVGLFVGMNRPSKQSNEIPQNKSKKR